MVVATRGGARGASSFPIGEFRVDRIKDRQYVFWCANNTSTVTFEPDTSEGRVKQILRSGHLFLRPDAIHLRTRDPFVECVIGDFAEKTRRDFVLKVLGRCRSEERIPVTVSEFSGDRLNCALMAPVQSFGHARGSVENILLECEKTTSEWTFARTVREMLDCTLFGRAIPKAILNTTLGDFHAHAPDSIRSLASDIARSGPGQEIIGAITELVPERIHLHDLAVAACAVKTSLFDISPSIVPCGDWSDSACQLWE